MCCFRRFFLENLHEFECHFLSDLCVNKIHASRQNNYLYFWHLLSSQQLLGNNKSLKKTFSRIVEGFHRKSQIFEGFRYPRTAPSYIRGFSRVCTNPAFRLRIQGKITLNITGAIYCQAMRNKSSKVRVVRVGLTQSDLGKMSPSRTR